MNSILEHAKAANTPGPTEGALFRTQLGDTWRDLSENIRLRFDHDPLPGTVARYRGVMSHVECSKIGKCLGWLVQSTGALMPHEGSNVSVLIDVWTQPGSLAVFKRREYFFKDKKPFIFKSRMSIDTSGRLIEHVGGGLGMYVRVHARDGDLHFEDEGFFVQLMKMKIPIPRLLGPGRVFLRHENIAQNEFAVTIEIVHPWFGLLFFQKGTFVHDR